MPPMFFSYSHHLLKPVPKASSCETGEEREGDVGHEYTFNEFDESPRHLIRSHVSKSRCRIYSIPFAR